MTGPKAMGVNPQGLPHVDVFDEQFAPQFSDGSAVVGLGYVLTSAKGAHTGLTNDKGMTPAVYTKAAQALEFGVPFGQLTICPDDTV